MYTQGSTHELIFSQRKSNLHLGGRWVFEKTSQASVLHRFQQVCTTIKNGMF